MNLLVRPLGLQPYGDIWQAMRYFTDRRTPQTPDELWLVEHPPVFTQGLNGDPAHLLAPGSIPVVQTDRGGQVTYHGPGQLILYPLLDLKRNGLTVRALVHGLEQSVINLLKGYGIEAVARPDAPGVYVAGAKIASLGLKVRRGCSYHGIALNVDMDLSPFERINPCGLQSQPMTQLKALVAPLPDRDLLAHQWVDGLCRTLGLPPAHWMTDDAEPT